MLGGLVTLCFLLPAVLWLPGREGGGVHEDSIDTLVMLAHSGTIRAAVLLYMLLMAGYNIAGGQQPTPACHKAHTTAHLIPTS